MTERELCEQVAAELIHWDDSTAGQKHFNPAVCCSCAQKIISGMMIDGRWFCSSRCRRIRLEIEGNANLDRRLTELKGGQA